MFFLCISAVSLVALENFTFGYLTFAAGLVSLFYSPTQFRKNMLLVYWAVALLSIAPINTSTEPSHIVLLGVPMALALFTPLLVSKYIYKNNLVRFPFNFRHRWARIEIFYYLLIVFIAYLIMPIILQIGNSYLNWDITS
ncbi:MAG TPA: hypothetical protein VD947_04715, partial [Patescibacteria group bacterium]|nr:hypothetical protein [Patescibacteria group bacterium]